MGRLKKTEIRTGQNGWRAGCHVTKKPPPHYSQSEPTICPTLAITTTACAVHTLRRHHSYLLVGTSNILHQRHVVSIIEYSSG